MAKHIVWTKQAKETFRKTLEFWVDHTKSSAYSKKLKVQIDGIIQLLAKYPALGLKTDVPLVRVKVFGYFKIYYEVGDESTTILLIWDTRQNPDDLEFNK